MLKKILILTIGSLLITACDKKTEPTDPVAQLANIQITVPEGITGDCIDALKAYHQVTSYMYDDPSSRNYNSKSSAEREEGLERMTNTLRQRSQQDCKELAYNLMISIGQLKKDSR